MSNSQFFIASYISIIFIIIFQIQFIYSIPKTNFWKSFKDKSQIPCHYPLLNRFHIDTNESFSNDNFKILNNYSSISMIINSLNCSSESYITYFDRFISTDQQLYLFANQIIQDKKSGNILRNEVNVFKALMYPNHYLDWGSYLPLLRIPNVEFLSGGEAFWVGNMNGKLLLYLKSQINDRDVSDTGKIEKNSPFSFIKSFFQKKSQEKRLFEEALHNGVYLEHPRDHFKEIWRIAVELGEVSNVATNDYGIVATWNYDTITLWNFHDYLNNPSDDIRIQSPTIYKIKKELLNNINPSDFKKNQRKTSTFLLRNIFFKDDGKIQDIFLLLNEQLLYIQWNTLLESVEELPIVFRGSFIMEPILQLHFFDNRDCHDAYLFPNDHFRCSCDNSKSSRLILQTAQALYIVSFKRENNEIQLTLIQKLQLPLQCMGEEVIFSKSRDDTIIAIGCSSTLHLYIADRDKFIWLDHTIDFEKELKSITFHNFELYYLTITFKNKSWSQIKLPTFQYRTCDPKTRLSSMFLPPVPRFNINEATEPIPNIETYNIEVKGLFSEKRYLILVVLIFFCLLVINFSKLKKLENYLSSNYYIKYFIQFINSKYLIYMSMIVMFSISLYEIAIQPAFVNDWPAHLQHLERYLDGQYDYSLYMHHHGPCTYPSGFMWLYKIFYSLTMGNLQYFQVIFSIIELANWYIIFSILQSVEIPNGLLLFSIFSNRLHLYNVRVVINDFPSVFLVHIVLWLLLKKKWLLSCILYSFIISTKLNFVFYGPAIALIIYKNTGIIYTIIMGITMLLEQILISITFLKANYKSYISNAFDIKRTLLWEKTKFLKFLGRELYHDPRISFLLLTITLITLILVVLPRFIFGFRFISNRLKSSESRIVHLFFGCNFIFITFARGLYTPFLCWYLYSLPILVYLSDMPISFVLISFLVNELFMRNWPNHETEMWCSLILFIVHFIIATGVVYSSWIGEQQDSRSQLIVQDKSNHLKVE